MTSIQYDLCKEALMLMLKDKYTMPNNIKDFFTKAEIIHETYLLLEDEQKALTKMLHG